MIASGAAAESSPPEIKQKTENTLVTACSFETLKLAPSDMPPSTRPFFLIFPKQFHKLGSKHSNIGANVESEEFSFKPPQGTLFLISLETRIVILCLFKTNSSLLTFFIYSSVVL